MTPFSLVKKKRDSGSLSKRTPSDSLPFCSASVLRTSWLPDLNLNTCILFTRLSLFFYGSGLRTILLPFGSRFVLTTTCQVTCYYGFSCKLSRYYPFV